MLAHLLIVVGSLLAEAQAAPVTDQARPVLPGQVRLEGWLGHRVDVNTTERLLKVSLAERVRPFASPNEREGWSGEHIGKWLHAAAIAYSYTHDAGLRTRLDQSVAALVKCQAADGYLGTYRPEARWGGWDVWTHKYNLLGLLACHEYTGNPQALAAAKAIGDLLVKTFGDGRRDIIRSGTHVGMAATSVLEPVVLLYRATRDPRYLEFAQYLVRAYDQAHGPKIVATLTATHSVAKTANRKAYEMMSNLVGLCELYRATGERRWLVPCLYAHDDIVANQMYLTGGTSLHEHFQEPHHLPNSGSVSENCAHVTWLQLCAQLFRITGDAKYADTLERIVYNHLLAAQHPDGAALCYFTPLAGRKPYTPGMNCCTSSGPRGIALVTTLAYTVAPTGLMVNFYGPSTLRAEHGGATIKLVQKTDYPFRGDVSLAVEPDRPAQFDLFLRIPGWCRTWKATVNGTPVGTAAAPGQYLRLARLWQPGDRVDLVLDMPALLVPGTHTNAGFVAVQRGPLVLAFDMRLNAGIAPTNISPLAGPDGTVALSLPADLKKIADEGFRGQGCTAVWEGDKVVLKTVPMVLTSFADAGSAGSSFAVWMPATERLREMPRQPFLFAQETWSQPGNVPGSIADGDPGTWRVTFDRRLQPEAWFAVERPDPVTINAVLYAHGQVYHDGGWWDTSRAKPRIQVKRAPGGKWEDLATLDSYPATTAATRPRLSIGQSFVVRFPATAAVGVRIIGTPACGDNPKQSFASCAELQGLRESAAPRR
jgi:uncharacterized protein